MSASNDMLAFRLPTSVVLGLVERDKNRTEQGREIREEVRANPGTALSMISTLHQNGGKRLPVLARALDGALAQIADPDVAKDLLNDHFTEDAQAAMVEMFGDLPSVLTMVCSPETIIASLKLHLAQAGEDENLSINILAWRISAMAHNLKDRKDWRALLDMKVTGPHTLQEILVAAVHFNEGDLDEVGLDSDDHFLEEPGPERQHINLTRIGQAEARKRARRAKKALEAATAPAAAAQALAEDVDI